LADPGAARFALAPGYLLAAPAALQRCGDSVGACGAAALRRFDWRLRRLETSFAIPQRVQSRVLSQWHPKLPRKAQRR
jgi:hypothetical protein